VDILASSHSIWDEVDEFDLKIWKEYISQKFIPLYLQNFTAKLYLKLEQVLEKRYQYLQHSNQIHYDPQYFWRALRLFYCQNKNNKEIAEILSISPDQARSMLKIKDLLIKQARNGMFIDLLLIDFQQWANLDSKFRYSSLFQKLEEIKNNPSIAVYKDDIWVKLLYEVMMQIQEIFEHAKKEIHTQLKESQVAQIIRKILNDNNYGN
jgi:hypothetical protein